MIVYAFAPAGFCETDEVCPQHTLDERPLMCYEPLTIRDI